MGAPPADIFQSLDPAALAVKDKDVVVSGAKLSRPSLLRGVECGIDQHPNPQSLGSWG
jgi:hypothetical protein